MPHSAATAPRTARHARGERGAAALSLLTLGVVISLMMVLFLAIPLTRASDAKAKSNSAADAAALAGADFVKTEIITLVENLGWVSGGLKVLLSQVQLGGTAASQYARLNEAQLIEYRFNTDTLTAYAKVRGRDVDGEIFTSEAWARIQLPDCDVADDPDADLAHAPAQAPGGATLVTPAALTRAADDDEDEDEDDDEPDLIGKTIKCALGGDTITGNFEIDPTDLGSIGDLAGLPLPTDFLDGLLGLIRKTEPQLIR